MELLLAGAIFGLAVFVGGVVFLARERRLSSRDLRLLATGCALALIAMLVTDWPWEILAEFWAEHSVLAGVLSTILLVGIGFLAFEVREVAEQEDLDRSLTAAGMGGLVDHVVDVEVAMALLCSADPPDGYGWTGWKEPRRPLRWLREHRLRLSRSHGGGPGPEDPRGWDVAMSPSADSSWRIELVDQSVRRLLAAIRDWSPVVGRSRNGMQALISMSELRNTLMDLERRLRTSPDDVAVDRLVCEVRLRCRVLAHALESSSGAPDPRPEVLLSLFPLEGRPGASHKRRGWLRHDWQVQLDDSEQLLRRDSV
jgi:hypothetical protein